MTSPPTPPRIIEPRLIGAGVVIAAAIPAILIATAVLWSNHLISLDDEAVISGLESSMLWALPLGPIGVLLVGFGLRLRSVAGWIGLFAGATPTFLIGWFVAAAFFGGLAGEPF